jgi:diaminopimelate decarboxylase
MYEAYHEIWPVAEPAIGGPELVDVVGPICESGDTFTTAPTAAAPPERPRRLHDGRRLWRLDVLDL